MWQCHGGDYWGKRSACQAQGKRLPRAITIYDMWITSLLGAKDAQHIPDDLHGVRSVFCRAANKQGDDYSLCHKHTQQLPELKGNGKRILTIAHHDKPHLSSVISKVRKLFLSDGRFSSVLFSAKDMFASDVRGCAMGLNVYYVELAGHDYVEEQVRKASLAQKTKSVLAAWGKVWSLSHLKSRRSANKWLKTTGLAKRRSLSPKDYWAALGKYRFLLAPSGNSVWSPKEMEALLMLTIPIVESRGAGSSWAEGVACFGYPMVIVDRWEEITERKLERWWAELAPQLHEARTRLLTEHWFSNVMGEGPESRSAACKALARDQK